MKIKSILLFIAVLTVYSLSACIPKVSAPSINGGDSTSMPEGTSSQGGGGNTVNGRLFDLQENAVAIEVSSAELLGLPSVREGLQRLYDNFPFLARLLVVHADDKPWVFDRRKISNHFCQNSSLTDIQKGIAACQTMLEVRIDINEWKKLSDEQKAALIIHELLVNQVLITNERYFEPVFKEKSNDHKLQSESVVREIVRQIFDAKSFNRDRVLAQIKKASFRFYVDRLLLKDKAPLLGNVYKIKSIYTRVTANDAEKDLRYLLGDEEQFLFLTEFSTKENYIKYLNYLKNVIKEEGYNLNCPMMGSLYELSAFEYFHSDSEFKLWDAKHIYGVEKLNGDLTSLSSIQLLAVALQEYPQEISNSDKFCSVFSDEFFVLGKTPFDPLPQEKAWVFISKALKEAFPLDYAKFCIGNSCE